MINTIAHTVQLPTPLSASNNTTCPKHIECFVLPKMYMLALVNFFVLVRDNKATLHDKLGRKSVSCIHVNTLGFRSK